MSLADAFATLPEAEKRSINANNTGIKLTSRPVLCQSLEQGFVIPAQAGIQSVEYWIPACAGMTIKPKNSGLTRQ
jgi:hypothetical protein